MQSHGGPQLVAELPQSLKNATASKYFGLSNVRYGSLADIGERFRDVRFTPKSGHAHRRHRCLLCAKSGHWARENFANQIANQLCVTTRYWATQDEMIASWRHSWTSRREE